MRTYAFSELRLSLVVYTCEHIRPVIGDMFWHSAAEISSTLIKRCCADHRGSRTGQVSLWLWEGPVNPCTPSHTSRTP